MICTPCHSRWKVYAGCVTAKGVSELKGRSSVLSRIVPVMMDVTNGRDVAAVVEAIAKDGGLFALVNNAGIGQGAVVDWMSMEGYRAIMEVNFFGLVSVTKACLPLLKASKGRIVNVTSIAGIFPGAPQMSAYSASKHAAEAFSSSLRYEMMGWGVKVVTVRLYLHIFFGAILETTILPLSPSQPFFFYFATLIL
jgi:NAD(P)-dependent dehydrogenase (short-subunit alcohol dehydrogenase family)